MSAPKSDEGAKGEGHHDSIIRLDSTSVQNVLPGRDPPMPIFGRIEDHHGLAPRTAGAVVPTVMVLCIGVV